MISLPLDIWHAEGGAVCARGIGTTVTSPLLGSGRCTKVPTYNLGRALQAFLTRLRLSSPRRGIVTLLPRVG